MSYYLTNILFYDIKIVYSYCLCVYIFTHNNNKLRLNIYNEKPVSQSIIKVNYIHLHAMTLYRRSGSVGRFIKLICQPLFKV